MSFVEVGIEALKWTLFALKVLFTDELGAVFQCFDWLTTHWSCLVKDLYEGLVLAWVHVYLGIITTNKPFVLFFGHGDWHLDVRMLFVDSEMLYRALFVVGSVCFNHCLICAINCFIKVDFVFPFIWFLTNGNQFILMSYHVRLLFSYARASY